MCINPHSKIVLKLLSQRETGGQAVGWGAERNSGHVRNVNLLLPDF